MPPLPTRSSAASPTPRQRPVRSRSASVAAAVLGMLLAMGGARAGSLDWRHADPQQLSDAGRGADAQRALDTLRSHLQALAACLPEDRRLEVELLDLDLAGRLEPGSQGEELRVLRGGADVPALVLRYALRDGGRTLAAGEERLVDLDYLNRVPRPPPGTPLAYETRLLDDWFARRFVAAGFARAPSSAACSAR